MRNQRVMLRRPGGHDSQMAALSAGCLPRGSGRLNPFPIGKEVRLRIPFALASLAHVMDKCVNSHSSLKVWVSRTLTISAVSQDPGLETLRD